MANLFLYLLIQQVELDAGRILQHLLHLQEEVPTVTTSASPPMLYDYRGFSSEVNSLPLPRICTTEESKVFKAD